MTKPKRKPRPPVVPNLPATFEQGQAAEVIAELDRFAGMVARAFRSQAGREVMRNHLIWQLRTGNSLDAANIIAMADNGHVVAIDALRIAVASYLDEGRKWDDLSLQVKAWHVKTTLRPVVGGYPRGGRLLVDSFVRDAVVCFMMVKAIERFSLPRRQAAKCVAEVCRARGIKIGRQQVERIHRERDGMAQQLVAFMTMNMQP